MENGSCKDEPFGNYTTFFGQSDVPEWEAFFTIGTLSVIILLTIIGNILNFFIVSLAVADLTVAILVLPFNVVYSVLGRWTFGMDVCKMWLTSDVLCCTASILNLCAIALDRFWAITDPINYAQKRTLKRVLLLIAGVWLLSLLISSPPLIGWNDWPDTYAEFEKNQECSLTRRQGYVIYSSLGSFFIPLFIMTIVYVEIFVATKRRLRERAQASKINTLSKNQATVNEAQPDNVSVSSETNHNDLAERNGKLKTKKKKKHPNVESNEASVHLKPILIHEDSLTDNPESSSSRKNSIPCTSTIAACPSTIVKINNEKQPQPKVVINDNKKGFVSQFIEEKQRISLSKERRAARTLGIIMGVFVVCWLPFFLMYVILPFCPTCCPSRRLINFITWLGYINSVLNPIIYTIFNLDFRRAFRKLLGLRP
ncbi:unnamed protein product [Brassicogethes aeneus]|uniref:Uncharacterized protein n=1 Tax=Brassicogethes aeneus TaxID=1431903 RepID=A0A9P0BD63_BRAAE|nr:unnamed protein product [Brassicogethes aeneus]